MKRIVLTVLGMPLLAVGAFGLFAPHFAADHETTRTPWLLLGFLGIYLLLQAQDNSLHWYNSGTVIGHRFEEGSFTPPHKDPDIHLQGNPGRFFPGKYHPGENVPPIWHIEIQDENGRTGWIRFSGWKHGGENNPFEKYPIGSHYSWF